MGLHSTATVAVPAVNGSAIHRSRITTRLILRQWNGSTRNLWLQFAALEKQPAAHRDCRVPGLILSQSDASTTNCARRSAETSH